MRTLLLMLVLTLAITNTAKASALIARGDGTEEFVKQQSERKSDPFSNLRPKKENTPKEVNDPRIGYTIIALGVLLITVKYLRWRSK